jgi:lipoprotein-anchoring transpeptidase ErfK/SrfK
VTIQASEDGDEPTGGRPKPVPLALLAGLTTVSALIALFFAVAHGSLAKIYVANLPVRATSSQAVLEKQIKDAAKSYQLKIKYVDGSVKAYPLAATGVTVDTKKSSAKARQTINSSILQRLKWWRPIKLPLYTKTNQETLRGFIAAYATQAKTPAQDASLAVDGGTITITRDVQGEGARVTNAEAAIPRAVAGLQTGPLTLQPAKLTALITAKDLPASQSKAQALLDQPVAFTVAGHSVTATSADIAGWVDFTPVPKAKTVDVTVDSGRILQYINKVARRYIAQPRSRLITNTAGGPVVLDPGMNGVDVVNKEETAAAVAKQLLANKGVNLDLPVQYAVAKTVEVQAADKWIVVDITNKRMYAYEQTNLARSFLVSAGAPATPTITGQYAIYAKNAKQDMRGGNADGSRYFQPDVPYVNYFYRDYAIHGNYWRPGSYFGNINSSHGCVGVQVDDGAWIFDWAPIGTPVIVHT